MSTQESPSSIPILSLADKIVPKDAQAALVPKQQYSKVDEENGGKPIDNSSSLSSDGGVSTQSSPVSPTEYQSKPNLDINSFKESVVHRYKFKYQERKNTKFFNYEEVVDFIQRSKFCILFKSIFKFCSLFTVWEIECK